MSKVEPFTHKQLQKQLDEDYYSQAKRSLVLLRNLKKIEVHLGLCDAQSSLQMDQRFRKQWKVVSKPETTSTIDPTAQETILQKIETSSIVIGSHRWYPKLFIEKVEWVVVTAFLSDACLQNESAIRTMAITEGLLSPQGSRKTGSIPDVGVAVQLSSDASDLTNSFYCSLPLPAPTGLPINCHGHFAISSDRRSIRIDGASGEWNEFLAKSCFQHLYFMLLECLCTRNQENYYSYWPSSTPAENAIIHKLQSSFWHDVRYTSRRIILSEDRKPFSMNQTILDGRILSTYASYAREGPVTKLVRTLRPLNCVLYEPRLINGLLDRMDGECSRDGEDVSVINPSFVRELLRETLAQGVLFSFDDVEIQDIFGFALDKGPLEKLVGCYIWRLADGTIFKLERVTTNLAYVTDEEGFDLFEKVGVDVLLQPRAIPPEILTSTTFDDEFNIRMLDGSVIDKFMTDDLPPQQIKTFTQTESDRLAHVWRYIFSNEFTVTFYETRPSLALTNDSSRFVSLQAFASLPIMGWNVSSKLSEVCAKLKISVLMETKLKRVRDLCESWHNGQRFLECLYRRGKNSRQIGELLDGLNDDDIRVYPLMAELMEDDSESVRGPLRPQVLRPHFQCHAIPAGLDLYHGRR